MVINILKIFKYIKNYEIIYKGRGEIVAYTNSDFADDPKGLEIYLRIHYYNE